VSTSANMLACTASRSASPDMSDIEQTFCLMGLIVCLGVCLVWALYEAEAWRQRHRWRAGLIRDAMRSVVTVRKDESEALE
jgi:hypothetical protein